MEAMHGDKRLVFGSFWERRRWRRASPPSLPGMIDGGGARHLHRRRWQEEPKASQDKNGLDTRWNGGSSVPQPS